MISSKKIFFHLTKNNFARCDDAGNTECSHALNVV